MNDPYKVLGLSPGASDDEVKKAYRKLAKKYHPDANPGDKVAEQKMKEINSAYDAIINKKAYGSESSSQGGYGGASSGYGYSSSYGGFDPFGFGFDFNGSSQQQRRRSTSEGNSYFDAAKNYINYGRYSEAINVLNSISDRNAEWYYLSALANAGLGNRINARQYAEKACSMEPNNMEYRSLLNRLNSNSTSYTNYAGNNGYTRPGLRINKFCLIYCIAQLLCGLCFGRGYGYRGYYC